MMAKNSRKKYHHVNHLLKNKWLTDHFLLASYFVFKTKTWQTTPFANNADRAAAHNVIQQSQGLTRFAKSQC